MGNRKPDQDEVFEGQFRRSRDGVFIVQDGDSGLKNGLRQKFSKKRLPEVDLHIEARFDEEAFRRYVLS
jgi:hypothetical protein